MHLTIGWLYSGLMNIYGDRGNVLALERRARWRGFTTEIRTIGIGQPIPAEVDVFFFGGGQDHEQGDVAADLQGAKGAALKRAVEEGAAMLAVCGGYQFLGHEYRPHQGPALPGIGLFDLVTVAGSERFIGNVVVDTPFGELVGFENHSGLTTLGPGAEPLGTVRIGRGNNGRDGTEGARYKHAAGCYLHGAVLPKNPGFADWLIAAGLSRRHGAVTLPPLDDDAELAAQREAKGRAHARM
ncbi:MAG: glutamine amidotransferase [Chloroflexota bacterium]|nr:glutamine amidotransferase [Chloroflexota bacterium]